MKSLKADKQYNKSEGKRIFIDRIRKLNSRLEAMGSIYNGALMRMRNAKVTRSMQDKHRQSTKDRISLKVLCISNTDYAKHQKGYPENSFPASVQATGVPSVRLCGLTLPSKDKVDTLKRGIMVTLPSILASMELWSEQSFNPRYQEMYRVVERPRLVRTIAFLICSYAK